MKKIRNRLGKLAQRIIDKAMGNGLMQEETSADGERYVTPGIGELIRQAGAEGCVLLKNNGALPLNREKEVAVFGRWQLDGGQLRRLGTDEPVRHGDPAPVPAGS